MRRYTLFVFFPFFLVISGRIAAGEQKVISILHVNDFHGFAEPYKPFGSDEFQGVL